MGTNTDGVSADIETFGQPVTGNPFDGYEFVFDFGPAFAGGVLVDPMATITITGNVDVNTTPSVVVSEDYDDVVGELTLGTGAYIPTSEVYFQPFEFTMTAAQAAVFGVGTTGFTFLAYANANFQDTVDVTVSVLHCFAEGTEITTPTGRQRVEHLEIGNLVTCEDGRAEPVHWIGRQTIRRSRMTEARQPVRIRAKALGNDQDLIVTADHGMIVDGLVINAGALVNGGSINWVPMDELPDSVTYYHVETRDHDVIFANGTPVETFIDHAGRRSFDNYQDYIDQYGAQRIIPEMPRIRVSTQRMLPKEIKARLGIADAGIRVKRSRNG